MSLSSDMDMSLSSGLRVVHRSKKTRIQLTEEKQGWPMRSVTGFSKMISCLNFEHLQQRTQKNTAIPFFAKCRIP